MFSLGSPSPKEVCTRRTETILIPINADPRHTHALDRLSFSIPVVDVRSRPWWRAYQHAPANSAGETDVLMIAMAVFLVLFILIVGVLI